MENAMAEDLSEREVAWRQYVLLVDMYKFYADASFKFNAFYYAITAAILSYVF